MKINKLLSSFIAVVIGFVFFIPRVLAAFGISPPWIVNENLKPGSSFVYVIDLNTNTPEQDMLVETEITGDPEIIEWLKIRDQEKLVMPKGEKHVPMYVEVNVPEDANLGKYTGDIGVTIVPMDRKSGSISIILGGHISVQLDVINYDVTDYWVKAVSLDPITAGQPINLNLAIKNLGNTPISNIETTVEISDYRTGDVVAKGSVDRLSSVVYPHTLKEVQMSLPMPDLEPGEYWTNVNVFKNRQSVYQNKLYLEVKPLSISNVIKTSVRVPSEDELKAAAIAEEPLTRGVGVKTAVRVRAPGINNLILVSIGLLIVLVVVTGKICLGKKKKKQS